MRHAKAVSVALKKALPIRHKTTRIMATGIGISNSDHVLSFSASQVIVIIAKRVWFSKNREKMDIRPLSFLMIE